MPCQVRLMAHAVQFLDSLPVKFRAKAYRSIGLLQEFGPFLREPHAKRVSGQPGLMELRVTFASDICRLFYFHLRQGVYVVTSGYQKKARKLDPREIRRAVESMRSLLEESSGKG
jgi:phage-related protein